VVIGENKTFRGDEDLLRTNNKQINILDSKDCQEILENYIKENHSTWYEDIGRDEH
jgi:cytosine deaminase